MIGRRVYIDLQEVREIKIQTDDSYHSGKVKMRPWNSEKRYFAKTYCEALKIIFFLENLKIWNFYNGYNIPFEGTKLIIRVAYLPRSRAKQPNSYQGWFLPGNKEISTWKIRQGALRGAPYFDTITFVVLTLQGCTIAHLKRHTISHILIAIKTLNTQMHKSYERFPKVPFLFRPPGTRHNM